MSAVALIDYGAGNLQSVRNALKAAGGEDIRVTADPDVVRAADRILLPGVGAFAHCMGALSAIDGMVEALNEATGAGGKPFLGICVGMQLMAEAGEEHGIHQGLGWVKGTVRFIKPSNPALKVPHMGWNDVKPWHPHEVLDRDGEAYFLHSYQLEVADPSDALALTEHGGWVVAAVAAGNRLGVQFHPEKSQGFGLGVLSRFLNWRP